MLYHLAVLQNSDKEHKQEAYKNHRRRDKHVLFIVGIKRNYQHAHATAILITNKTMNSIDSPHHGILDKKIVELFSGLHPLTIRRF